MESGPIKVSERQLAADLMMADLAEKEDGIFEKRLEKKMGALDDKDKMAYNKLVQTFNSDIVVHEDIFNICQAVLSGRAFSCAWETCRLKFSTKNELEIHATKTKHFK